MIILNFLINLINYLQINKGVFLELKKLKINNLILENLLYEYQVNLIKNNDKDPWILVNEQNIYKEDYRKKIILFFIFIHFNKYDIDFWIKNKE